MPACVISCDPHSRWASGNDDLGLAIGHSRVLGIGLASSAFVSDSRVLYWAIIFFIFAIFAAFFGFSSIAVATAGIAKLLFVIFLVLFVFSLIFGSTRRPGPHG